MNISFLPVVIVAAGTAVAMPTFAQEVTATTQGSAQERIAASVQLGVLSQAVPAAACHFASGVESAGAILQETNSEFAMILDALEYGDAELGIIGAEERRKTVAEIEEMRVLWAPLATAADAIIAGEVNDANLQVLLSQNASVLNAVGSLTAHLSGEYANPAEIVKADAFLLDIVGRQEMLVQQMLKASCMVSTGLNADGGLVELEGAMQIFGTALTALRDGMAAAGIRKPPTPEISTKLQDVAVSWSEIRPVLDSVMAGTSLDFAASEAKFRDLNALMSDMDEVLGMYMVAFQ
jgi:hypothetical protein